MYPTKMDELAQALHNVIRASEDEEAIQSLQDAIIGFQDNRAIRSLVATCPAFEKLWTAIKEAVTYESI